MGYKLFQTPSGPSGCLNNLYPSVSLSNIIYGSMYIVVIVYVYTYAGVESEKCSSC